MRSRVALAAVAVLAAVRCAASGGDGAPEEFFAAAERALGSGAEWRMERRLPGSERTMVSSGTVECTPGRGISWRTLEPFAELVEMRAEGMVFEDEDGRRFRPAESVPHYGEIRAAADAFASGDGAAALERGFSVEALPCGEGGGEGAWRVVLVPRNRELREFLQAIEVSGAGTVTGAVLRTRGGGETAIGFAEAVREP